MSIIDRDAKLALLGGRESRRFAAPRMECRDRDGGAVEFRGYASVTEHPYDMGLYTETIHRGSFARTLGQSPDVVFLLNHDGLPIAKTGVNLELGEDLGGLEVEALMDGADPDVQTLQRKVRNRLVDEMSFAFRVVDHEWSEDRSERHISAVDLHRGDVSAVTFGANPATSISTRQFGAAMHEVRSGAELSPATLTVLGHLLELFAAADNAVDEGQEVLADLIGVANPDVEDDPAAGGDLPDAEDDTGDLSMYGAMSLDVALAMRDALRLHGEAA